MEGNIKMDIEKNKEYIVDIIDNGYEGEGIAKINDFTIFIPGAIKGEKVKVIIVKVLSSHAFGKIVEIINTSNSRKEVDCTTYRRCGGCNLRHINYADTLNIKREIVQNLVNKTLKNEVNVKETIGMDKPFYYRNKAQYPVGKDKENKPVMGVFANRTHEIIPINKCYIQNEQTEEIAKYAFELWNKNNLSIYDEKTRKGLLRHIVTKIGIKTNEIMLILVINGDKFKDEEGFVRNIINRYPNVKTIVKKY